MSRPVQLKGFKLDKHGRIVPNEKRFNVSKQLQRRGSQKMTYKRGKR